MGQEESKQKLQQLTEAVGKIRKDIKTGKVTTKNKEKYLNNLKTYTNELETSYKTLQESPLYNHIEKIINDTKEELNAVSSGSSRKSSKKLKKLVNEIMDAVEKIRVLIGNEQLTKQYYDGLHSMLLGHSLQLTYLEKEGNAEEINAAQKLVSSVTEELLARQEQDSSTEKSPKQRLSENIFNQGTIESLDDIENKLETLKVDIKFAESNRDRGHLHSTADSLQSLLKELQMIRVGNHAISEQRKELLETYLILAHQQIDKIIKQITVENDMNYLTGLQKQEKIEQRVQDLEDMEKALIAINQRLNHQTLETEKETFNDCKRKLDSIKHEALSENSPIADLVATLDDRFLKLEMETKLNEAEENYYKFVINFKNFGEIPDLYEKYRHDLLELKKSVIEILGVTKNLEEKKKFVAFNIDNSLAILEQKPNGLVTNCLDDIKATSAQEKEFILELKELKDKVSLYSGTYKNVLYRSIEKDLNKCLCNVDFVFNDSGIAAELKKIIEDHKTILEQKCNKNVKQDGVNMKKLNEIKETVETVKKELGNRNILTKEELDKWDYRLTLSILTLDNIKDEQQKEERKTIYQDIHFCSARIHERMVSSKPEAALTERQTAIRPTSED